MAPGDAGCGFPARAPGLPVRHGERVDPRWEREGSRFGSAGGESKTLDSVCKRLNIDAKNDKYEVATARAAMDGDKAAQRKLRRYNENDTAIMAAVYERLLPYVKGHPHVAPGAGMDKTTCPRCGSPDVTRVGNYSPSVYNYMAYKCNACSGPFRTTYESRGPSVRAL